MALTRKFLTAMGIESEKIDQIIEAHTESVDALKEQRNKYKESAEKLPEVQKELDEVKAAQKGDLDTYKAKYEKEHADFEQYKSEQSARETKEKKTAAYRELLKEAGISDRHINSVLRASDVNSAELDEDGKIKDSKTLLKGIKEEWSDFITVKDTKGANVANPPQNNPSNLTGDAAYAKKFADRYFSNKYGAVQTANNNTTNGGNT